MRRGVGVCDLSLLHIDLDDGKASDQPSIDAIDADIGDGLVFCGRLAEQGRDICHIAFGIHQIDVGVLIDGNQTIGLLTPTDMGDMGITQTIDTVISRDTLIVEVILVKAVRSQYKEIVACLLDILYLMIGEIMLPGTDLRL